MDSSSQGKNLEMRTDCRESKLHKGTGWNCQFEQGGQPGRKRCGCGLSRSDFMFLNVSHSGFEQARMEVETQRVCFGSCER